ncbi:MAG TPA: RdgB/HAM1 family non-canonical purine NTP pyrophosphatase [bacterium]|nr:RdgB/HAM1 family non-canonical purine NTP pyrophosphatase [bacterium]
MKTLVLATRNRKKEKELVDLLAGLGWEVRCLADFLDAPDVVEDGETFLENARKKAIEVSRYTQGIALADDSGLAVDALGGAPGVYSARYAAAVEGNSATDEENRLRLLREMEGVPQEKRTGRFICAAVIACEGKVIFETEQSVEGVITSKPRGSGGFGYDPLFFYPPFGATFAEVPIEQKHAVSHRGKALAEVRMFLVEDCGLRIVDLPSEDNRQR